MISAKVAELFAELSIKGNINDDLNKLNAHLKDTDRNLISIATKSPVLSGKTPVMAALAEIVTATTAAAAVFASAAAALSQLAAVASPNTWNTFTSSMSLLSAEIGQLFVPALIEASKLVQDLVWFIRDMDPATKQAVADTILWVTGITEVIFVGRQLLNFLDMFHNKLETLSTFFSILFGSGGNQTLAGPQHANAHHPFLTGIHFQSQFFDIEQQWKRLQTAGIRSSLEQEQMNIWNHMDQVLMEVAQNTAHPGSANAPPGPPPESRIMQYGGLIYIQHCMPEGPPTESTEDSGTRAVKVYDVPYALKQASIRTLIGYAFRNTNENRQNYISRVTPHPDVDWLDNAANPYLFCTKVDSIALKPLRVLPTAYSTGNESIPVADTCRLTATYSSLPYDILTDSQMISNGYTYNGAPDESTWRRYVTIIPKPIGTYFSLPPTGPESLGYKYVGLSGTPAIVTQGVQKLIVPYNLQVTWHCVPQSCVPCRAVNGLPITQQAIDVAVGKVNSVTLNGYLPGTLLLMGVVFRPYRSAFGLRVYDCDFMFKYFEPIAPGFGAAYGTGHQFIFNPLTPAWTEITTNGATNQPGTVAGANVPGLLPNKSIYDWADLTGCFRSP